MNATKGMMGSVVFFGENYNTKCVNVLGEKNGNEVSRTATRQVVLRSHLKTSVKC